MTTINQHTVISGEGRCMASSPRSRPSAQNGLNGRLVYVEAMPCVALSSERTWCGRRAAFMFGDL
jgi:hypothetical protein